MGYVTNQTYSEAYDHDMGAYIASSDILYFRGHGDVQFVLTTNSFFTVDVMAGYKPLAFTNCRLVLYGACFTGYERSDYENLVNATAALRAQTVLGFTTEVDCNEMNDWAVAFFEALSEGDTIEDAAIMADYWIIELSYDEITTSNPYIAGDKDATLTQTN